MNLRNAEAFEIGLLACLWHEGWHEAHAHLLPPELTRYRTLDNFRERLHAALPRVRVAGPLADPRGFCIVRDDELYQLFVAARARGTGISAALVADAEARLADAGFETAWLACAIGNKRAATFYEKCGWHRVGIMVNPLQTAGGMLDLDVWRYEKEIGRHARRIRPASLAADLNAERSA